MAIVQRIRELFIPAESEHEEKIVPAPPAEYSVRPMTEEHLREVMLLNLRCFRRGENYTKYTFKYLLSEPNILSYRAVTSDNLMVGFIFVVAANETIAHITTIGVAPEHRKRGIAGTMLEHAEKSLVKKGFDSIVLEVRVSNEAALELYFRSGYVVMQRLTKYYNNGEDAFLMSKVIS